MSTEAELGYGDVSEILEALDDPVMGTYRVFGVSDTRPIYRELLRECPVVRTERGGVYVFSMEANLEVNRRHDVLGNGGSPNPSNGQQRPLLPLDLDGTEHTKWRRLLDPMLAPKAIAFLDPEIRRRANELIDSFAGRGRAELTREFCEPLPCRVFLDLIGMPQDRLDEFLQFKNDVIRPGAEDPEERLQISRAAGERMYGFLGEELDRRLRNAERKDDLIDRLMYAEVDGAPLTRENLFDICYLLMFAGLDTVTSSLSCLLAWLAKHPDARRSLVSEPELIPAAVEELMRVESPVQGTHRYATRDFELAGVPIHKGDRISVMWAGANLDGSAFESPLEVDLRRQPNRHIAFASGFHRCLGSHLARQELRCALEEFHRRIPDYSIAPGEEAQYSYVGVRTVDRLPVVF
jgi:cytochrome P450